jgi:hypothetical protein
VRYLRAAERRGDHAHPALAELDPAVAAASRLARGDARARLVVEAALLGSLGADAIAARAGLDPAAVEAFAKLFFAVDGQLGARDFIVFTVLPGLHAGPPGPDDATVVKALGFFHGPLVLDAAAHDFGVRPAPPGSEPNPELVRLVRMAAAALRLQAGRTSAAAALRLRARLEEVEREQAGRSANPVLGPVTAACAACESAAPTYGLAAAAAAACAEMRDPPAA